MAGIYGSGSVSSTLTGGLTGTVGSVTGTVGSVTGTVGSVTDTVGSTVGSVLGSTGSGSGSSGGGTVGGVVGSIFTGLLPTLDPDGLLGGMRTVTLPGLAEVTLLNQSLLDATVSLGGSNLILGANVQLGGVLGTDSDDLVKLSADSMLGSVVFGDGDDSLLSPDTSIVTGIIDGGAGNDLLGIGAGNAEIRGGSGDDRIMAIGYGDNMIDGGSGADNMRGGAGDDTYIVDNAGDEVIEAAGQGTDTVRASVSFNLGGQEIENLALTGTAATNGTGNELANRMVGNDAANTLDGGAGADTLSGRGGDDTYIVDNVGDQVIEALGGGNDTVRASVSFNMSGQEIETLVLTGSSSVNATGNELANAITGNNAANLLDGGAGADTLTGRGGDDLYIVDDAGDRVVEAAGGGNDEVRASVSFGVGDQEVETVTLTGTAAIDAVGNDAANTLIGNDAANTLDGGAGADTLAGRSGDDIYIVDDAQDTVAEVLGGGNDTVRASVSFDISGQDIENLELTGRGALTADGNDLANNLVGNDAANILDGGAGVDRMTGNKGDDTYIIDNADDRIVEVSGGGNDTAVSTVSYRLYSEVENITLAGRAAIDATGNSSANTMVGNDAANRLDGGAGADTMIGGKGDDTYIVDNVGDTIIERAAGGTDFVRSTVSYSLANQVIENLSLIGTAAIDATGNQLVNRLTGNDAANVLDGGAGADRMYGNGGDDTYIVDNASDQIIELRGEGNDSVLSTVDYRLSDQVETLTLTGNALKGYGSESANTLIGNDGANQLDGAGGADTMVGGIGDDTYMVDNSADQVIERAGEGTDLIKSTATFSLVGQAVENLYLDGTAAINGTGNELNNIINGNGAANIIDGGTGADLMRGGAGNDTFVVDNTGDVVRENLGEGIDTVTASISYTLGEAVENLTLLGSAALKGTGNDGANSITGNDGANTLSGLIGIDTLSGGGGNDTLIGGVQQDFLTGGGGADRFVFNTGDFGGRDQAVADVITDFSHADGDKIDLSSLDANLVNRGNQAFTFVGTNAFTGAGQLHIEQSGDDLFLSGNLDGNLDADFTIKLGHLQTLQASDIVL